jgi:serine/threonine protein kinase
MLITEIRKISQGAFGETLLVEREGKRYVLKRLKQSAIADHGQVAMSLFEQESGYLKELGTHTQIPALIDAGHDERGPWILQEYIPGPTLEQLLVEQGRFNEDSITELLKSILPVLGFIHEHSAIHRDVKPANIIVHEGLYYLVDFGASKKVSETVLAKTGTSIGTASYAAPEQVIGKAGYSSDIYSLGVTCIHLLTGMQPYELISLSEPGQWCWRDYLGTPVAEGLAKILDRMLEYSAARRYNSPDRVLEALRLIDKYEVEKRKAKKLAQRKRNSAIAKWSRRVGVAVFGIGVIVGTAQVVPQILNPLLNDVLQEQTQKLTTGQCEGANCHGEDKGTKQTLSGPLANTFNALGAVLPSEVRPVLWPIQFLTVFLFGSVILVASVTSVRAARAGDEDFYKPFFGAIVPLVMIVSLDAVAPNLATTVESTNVEHVLQSQ